MPDDLTPDAPNPRPSIPRLTAEYRPPERHHVESNPTGKRLAVLTLTALGVVYGDIGTSPLYAMKEAFSKPEYGLQADPATIYGVLSLILWSLILVVSVKYISFILRADNKGEGGILAMLALLLRTENLNARKKTILIALGLFGAGLLYGDGIITPAMSVLGAMEGLEVASDIFHPFIVPVSVGIIIGLFIMQKFGTHRVGVFFGPMMLLWFGTIGGLGLIEVIQHPSVLVAINPAWGIKFFLTLGPKGFIALGAVVLAVTGAEALYADMGHFGARPIRTAWFWLVLPALALNYFGQGSLLLRDPTAIENPFFLLAPNALLYPLIVVATSAAIIASQALISGAFSLTQQCIQLGYCPRLTIVHTSAREFGQIYVPEVNWALAVGTVLVVLGFRNTGALGAAYGIAVTGTMVITSLLYFAIATERWKQPLGRALLVTALFLIVDIAFLGANLIKILHGGWVPLLLGIVLFVMMTSWKRGRAILTERMQDISFPMEHFIADIGENPRTRVPGTAVFMTSEPLGVPVVLLHHLKHNKVLHETVLLLSIQTADVPETARNERVFIEALGHGLFRVVAVYGFMESPDVKEILQRCRDNGIAARPLDTSYYLGREQLIPRRGPWKKGGMSMNIVRKKIFSLMSRNARSATEYFQLPPNRVVELGTQIEF